MVPVSHSDTVIKFYDTHPINEDEILQKVAAQGKSVGQLSQIDLAELDQDHYGGTEFLDTLADAAGITEHHHVLDVCSGMGGPARWIAHWRGCRVTGLDFTRSRVEAARRLTQLVKLEPLVDFTHGDAVNMPFDAGQFDILLAQESWLHIPDKISLVAECMRVLKPGGVMAFTDIVANTLLDPQTEKRLAEGMHTANIATADEYIRLIKANNGEIISQHNLSSQWKEILQDRLQMFRSLRDTTVAKFGEARFTQYDTAYSHFVGCFTSDKLGGVRVVAKKPL